MNAFSNEPQTITVIAKLIVTTPAGAAFENRFKNQADTVEWMKACLNCNANHAKVDIEPLCASDDPAFQAQISALKEVTDTLNTGLGSEDQEEDPTPEQLAALSRFRHVPVAHTTARECQLLAPALTWKPCSVG
ncbi:hypothetical protein CtCNB1_2518 [Comamonas thiooxydans]|nr:hypothetical protein CtCNB1_2518 [Comamonas thiooxydans]